VRKMPRSGELAVHSLLIARLRPWNRASAAVGSMTTTAKKPAPSNPTIGENRRLNFPGPIAPIAQNFR
jgi:hypothetical protein